MLFLPALERNGDINYIKKEAFAHGHTIRGMYGEGTATYGSYYQILVIFKNPKASPNLKSDNSSIISFSCIKKQF